MGTPGDKSGLEKVEETVTVKLEDSDEDAESLFKSVDPPAAEMTILGFPEASPSSPARVPLIGQSLTDFFIDDDHAPKLSQTYIDEFYQEHKVCPSTSSECAPPQVDVFLEQPGPSGLQHKPRPSSKFTVKRLKNVQSKKLHTCQICDKSFPNSNKLSKHLQLHANSSPFRCENCKKSFSSKFKLVRHVLIHSDRKPFSCAVCERTFHRKDHLKNHVKVHSPCKKLYVCEKTDCKKEYTSSLSYKKHLALHAAEEGILDCQICSKSFKTKEEILYHLKIHAGSRTVKNPEEKKYSCDHCQRKFFTRKDVRRHLVVHTGKRDFLCQFCPQRFGRKDHLVRHIKKSHQRGGSVTTSTVVAVDEVTVKSEAEESNAAPDDFSSNLDLDSLLTENFPMLTGSPRQFLPHASSQGELTDLGSEVLDEIAEVPAAEIFEDDVLIPDSPFIDLLQHPGENTPLPAFSQIFQSPPQPPPPK